MLGRKMTAPQPDYGCGGLRCQKDETLKISFLGFFMAPALLKTGVF